jgi:DNA-binding CsgD family transcriptional regulator
MNNIEADVRMSLPVTFQVQGESLPKGIIRAVTVGEGGFDVNPGAVDFGITQVNRAINTLVLGSLGYSQVETGRALGRSETVVGATRSWVFGVLEANNMQQATSLAFTCGVFMVTRSLGLINRPTDEQIALIEKFAGGSGGPGVAEVLGLRPKGINAPRERIYGLLGTTGMDQTILLSHLSGLLAP